MKYGHPKDRRGTSSRSRRGIRRLASPGTPGSSAAVRALSRTGTTWPPTEGITLLRTRDAASVNGRDQLPDLPARHDPTGESRAYAAAEELGYAAPRRTAATRGMRRSPRTTSMAWTWFHTGGDAATRELAEHLELRAWLRALDVGSGPGGPARHLAQHAGADCRTARSSRSRRKRTG